VSVERRERVRAFEAGAVAASVKSLALSGRTAAEVHADLLGKGFLLRREPMLARRGRQGQPLWLRRGGGTTAAANDPEVALVDVYVHSDGAIVRLYLVGDPRRPLARDAEAPWATVGVLLVPPTLWTDAATGEQTLEVDLSPSNEVSWVTEQGHAIPRSGRAAHGLKQDRRYPLSSLMLARGVLLEGRRLLKGSPNEDPLPKKAQARA
jgi:hypothetical protein